MAVEWETNPGLEEFELDPNLVVVRTPPKKQRRVPNRKRFIFGPLSMEWIHRASKLPGKTLCVALVLRHLEGLNKGKRVSFPFSNVEASRWGISRKLKCRALAALERAGLIAVERRRGASPLATVIEVRSGGA